MLSRGNVILPSLAPLSGDIRDLVVEGNRYDLSADNLRIALGLADSDPVSLEALTDAEAGNETVYSYVLADLPGYLAAVDGDGKTPAAVTAPRTLAKVLSDIVENRTGDQESGESEVLSGDLADLLSRTAPSARLRYVRNAPRVTWTALAEAKRFRSSLANVESYRGEIGSVDSHLAQLLADAGTVHIDEKGDTTDPNGDEYDRQAAALAILNTSALTTHLRVDLVTSMKPELPLPALSIAAERNDLFARMLNAQLVSDDEETFSHLRAGGWAALGPAIAASQGVKSFLSAALLEGMVADALSDENAAEKVENQVLADVNTYVPEDDWAELRAVAIYADQHRVALDPAVVARIARVGDGQDGRDRQMMLRLLDQSSPRPSADHVVETFLHLGGPYNRITNPQDSFDLDFTDVHDRLLRILHSESRISRGYPRIPTRRYSVTVS
jgi:hypothetical protein